MSERTYNADIYVFCVQTERDLKRWNALDLEQWEFYVLPRSVLEARGVASLRLSTVQALTRRLRADELPAAIAELGAT